jgi:hypothetical protein
LCIVANVGADIWFHRYEEGRDIEGRFDYNSWQESETGRKLAASLDKDIVLAEGEPLYQPTESGSSEQHANARAFCRL